MSKYPYRQDREEIKALLQQFDNLKAGQSNSFIEEDSFERIIDYFDEKEQLNQALEAAEYGTEQYPYSSMLLLKKADILIALRHYKEALFLLSDLSAFITGHTLPTDGGTVAAGGWFRSASRSGRSWTNRPVES